MCRSRLCPLAGCCAAPSVISHKQNVLSPTPKAVLAFGRAVTTIFSLPIFRTQGENRQRENVNYLCVADVGGSR
jgi:hypothetical protein